MTGPDHKASADISELTALVKAVRDASASLGDGIKRPAAEEAETRPKIRKSLVCGLEHIKAGTVLTPEMLEIKRPWVEGAIEPFELDKVLGQSLTNEKSFDEPILWSDLKS
jgi:sialic acid synthase SpsE